jgi:hypothetical protein
MWQLISQFIVREDDETSLLASKSMLKGEMGIATISFKWKVGQ